MRDPWLMIIGVNEDGLDGLSQTSRDAIAAAEIVFGGPRHLDLVGAQSRGVAWPVPFDIAPVLAQRGRAVVILASGDPFWFGAGGSIAPHLAGHEWRAIPAPSTFSLMASGLGWGLEGAQCYGLHAAPFSRILPSLQNNARLLCLVRDGLAPLALAKYLCDNGFGASTMHVMEALGGPRARIRQTTAATFDLTDVTAPVAVAISANGRGLSRASGLNDDQFASDGQITKRPIRALTLAALAPRMGEVLWDIGGGSGSVSVEWCLAGGRAITIEAKPLRVQNIQRNADTFGIAHRMQVIEGTAPLALTGLGLPDAVFVGGGGNQALYGALLPMLARGTRLVANSVTLETDALLVQLQAQHGGELIRIDLASAVPLGRMSAWQAVRPVVQWSVTL
jgi:precorrin-6Y C5,15-methyltransferase (decarboxylating)